MTPIEASRWTLLEKRGRALGFTAAASALFAVSCGSEGREAPLPPRPAVVDITMRDYRFSRDRSVPDGRVVVRVRNAGRRTHDLTLLALPEGFPPIDVQLRGTTRRSLPTLASLHNLRPGASDSFAVDLAAGRYAILCYVTDSNGVTHARGKGMSAEFRVR